MLPPLANKCNICLNSFFQTATFITIKSISQAVDMLKRGHWYSKSMIFVFQAEWQSWGYKQEVPATYD